MPLGPGLIVALLAVAVIGIIVAVVMAGRLSWRRRALRQRYGPEYERLARQQSPSEAERELLAREERHRQLELRQLDDATREDYRARWTTIQAGFIDRPSETVAAADELVTRLIGHIGYPVDDFDERLAQLSVDHARTLDRYRHAHHLHLLDERHQATADQQREAIVHYRALFAELLDADPVAPDHLDHPAGSGAAPSEGSHASGSTATTAPVEPAPA